MESCIWPLSEFFRWLLRSSAYAGMLVCLVLAVRGLVGHTLAARWQYLLWLLVGLRLLLPAAPQSNASILNLIPDSAKWGARTLLSAEVTAGGGETEAVVVDGKNTHSNATIEPSGGPALRVADVLALVWLAGGLILALYVFVITFRMWRMIRGVRPLTERGILDLLEDCKGQAGVKTILGVIVTDRVKSPALFGFVRPRLLLPAGIMETQSLEQLRHIFLHELSHLKRHDILLGWVTSLLLVLHWFNPLLWYASYRMRQDRELACDALALSVMGVDESREYGRTIVRLLKRFSCNCTLPVMAAVSEDTSNLQRRVAMISQFRKERHAWSAIAVSLIVALGFVSLTDARQQVLLPPTRENLLKVLAQPLSEAAGAELLEHIDDYTDASAIHLETVKNIDCALEEELAAYEAIGRLLEGEDFGNLEADDVITARQYLGAAILNSRRARAGLDNGCKELEYALRALGIGTESAGERDSDNRR